jgi:hypothetical protein
MQHQGTDGTHNKLTETKNAANCLATGHTTILLRSQKMVRVTGYKLNPQLLRWLREHPAVSGRCGRYNESLTYHRTCWRLRDRLTERDIVQLMMAYKTGIATKELAERYGINVKSVRKLLLEFGAKQRSQNDPTHRHVRRNWSNYHGD